MVESRCSSARARSTIRARRFVITASIAPMPESRNTGATESWMACPTVVIPLTGSIGSTALPPRRREPQAARAGASGGSAIRPRNNTPRRNCNRVTARRAYPACDCSPECSSPCDTSLRSCSTARALLRRVRASWWRRSAPGWDTTRRTSFRMRIWPLLRRAADAARCRCAAPRFSCARFPVSQCESPWRAEHAARRNVASRGLLAGDGREDELRHDVANGFVQRLLGVVAAVERHHHVELGNHDDVLAAIAERRVTLDATTLIR